MSKDTSKNVKWIDGLRGVASFTVVCTHLSRAFAFNLFAPRDTADSPVRIAQLPIIRLLFQGKIGVVIFALLTGYVCALKPLKQARSGKHGDALSTIAKSSFRRPPRLMLPATIALVIAWTLCQSGAFVTATRSDCDWFRFASPVPDPTLWMEVKRLIRVFWSTWTNGHMDYDDHQWTLLPLLKGSMIVFVLLSGVIYARFRFRMAAYIFYLCYWWQNTNPDTETFGFQVVFGILLSDLALHPPFQKFLTKHPKFCNRISIPILVAGLYIASYPDREWYWAAWSRGLDDLGLVIFPRGVNFAKRFSALGMDMVAFAIQLNAPAKTVLSNRFFLWLGRNSFAVYLLHGTLLRTVLAWMLYGISGQPWQPPKTFQNKNGDDEQTPAVWIPRRAHGIALIAVIAVWFCIVYYCAHLWTTYVDAWCGKATKILEDFVFLPEDTTEEEESFTEKMTVNGGSSGGDSRAGGASNGKDMNGHGHHGGMNGHSRGHSHGHELQDLNGSARRQSHGKIKMTPFGSYHSTVNSPVQLLS